MPRPKKIIPRSTAYADAAAALRDLNRLDNAASPTRPPLPVHLCRNPFGQLVKRKTSTLGALLALDRERRPEVPITLPPVSMGTVSDDDVGLAFDPIAQERAERFLINAFAFQRREAEKEAARRRLFPGPTIHEEVPDESFALVQLTDRLTPIEAGIVAELNRLAARSSAPWLSGEIAPVPKAS